MVKAEPHLSSVTRAQTPEGDAAELQTATLPRPYRRQPGHQSDPAASIPKEYKCFCAQLEQPIIDAVSGLPDTALAYFLFHPFPGSLASGTLSSRSELSDLGDTDDEGVVDCDAKGREDLSAEAEARSIQYAKERSVTWEELRNRVPLFGGPDGVWRFSSAEDIIRSRQL
jgi:hypothetical protein